MSFPIITTTQDLNQKGIPMTVPTEAEVLSLSHPGCQFIHQFMMGEDPILSEYLYFLDFHNLDKWSELGAMINRVKIWPEALSQPQIQEKLMIYLEDYDRIKMWPSFSLQKWIDHDLGRTTKFNSIVIKRDYTDDLKIIIEGDQVWLSSNYLDWEVFQPLLSRQFSLAVFQHLYRFTENIEKELRWCLSFVSLEQVKIILTLLSPDDRRVPVYMSHPSSEGWQIDVDDSYDYLETRFVTPINVPRWPTTRYHQPIIDYLIAHQFVPVAVFRFDDSLVLDVTSVDHLNALIRTHAEIREEDLMIGQLLSTLKS